MTCKFLLKTVVFWASFLSVVYAQDLTVFDPTCDYKTDPIGIDDATPQFSWKLGSNGFGILQSAYQIRVATSISGLEKGYDVQWDSGKIDSDQSIHVAYGGDALKARQRYYWQVKVWDNKGHESGWSAKQYWEMGLLDEADWTGKWITTGGKDTLDGPSPIFCKSFNVPSGVKSARLYATARGVYEARINGHRVGEDYFTPGWTSYHNRLQYQVYDVSSLLIEGGNAISITLGDGWYRGHTYDKNKAMYGEELALLAQLEIELRDGSRILVNSDESWEFEFGPIRSSSFFNGEVYDARLINFEEKAARPLGMGNPVVVADYSKSGLVATYGPPVRKHESLRPVNIFKTPMGEVVADFGQNFAGFIRLKVRGSAGSQIKLQHAEVLDEAGNFYTDNLRAARQEICYTLNGRGEEIYEPHFTFQGFRYVKIELKGLQLDDVDLSAVVLYSDMRITGKFETSDSLLNQLQHNILWSQKSNFIEVPADCPQRDERLGWTGDAQAFYATAAFNMDIASFSIKWLGDLRADQRADGAVPFIVPAIIQGSAEGPWYGTSGYSDAATIVPWKLYQRYGDKRILAHQYESMKLWVDYVQTKSNHYLWNTGFHYGDHVSFEPTDKLLVAQAFAAHSVQNLINAAAVLGINEDVRSYSVVLDSVKAAFAREYINSDGSLTSPTQGAYVLALKFDLIPDSLVKQAITWLVKDIKDRGNLLSTGFMATPHLNLILSKYGFDDVAYDLLWQDSCPSWLYPVKRGATTIWERWDGIKPDNQLQDPFMNSFNHFANGSIGDWMYQTIGGIRLDEAWVGYKRFFIQPVPHDRLKFANSELETPYGKIATHWKIEGNQFDLEVDVPPNTEAEVIFPHSNMNGLDKDSLRSHAGVRRIKSDKEKLVVTLGSGNYRFHYFTK